jgi:hypothetical protein
LDSKAGKRLLRHNAQEQTQQAKKSTLKTHDGTLDCGKRYVTTNASVRFFVEAENDQTFVTEPSLNQS